MLVAVPLVAIFSVACGSEVKGTPPGSGGSLSAGLDETPSETAVTRTRTPVRATQPPATATETPDAASEAWELPDGWTRVQARKGLLARNASDPLAGFTIDLPPGWTVGESWPSSHGFSGWIAGPIPPGGVKTPILRFYVGVEGSIRRAEILQADDRSVVTFPVIEGQEAMLYLAQPSALDSGPQVGIYFEHMPGGDVGEITPSLRVDGDARGWVDQELLGRVLTSIRYKPLTALPELPVLDDVPIRDDWVRTPARTDLRSFTMLLPPGWEFENRQGIDTLVGILTNGELSIFYDFGAFAGSPYSPSYRAIADIPNPPHVMWEEALAAGDFQFVKPESPEADEFSTTGVFIRFANLDNRKLPARTTWGPAHLGMSVNGLNGDEQLMVLAMFRSLELERDAFTRKP